MLLAYQIATRLLLIIIPLLLYKNRFRCPTSNDSLSRSMIKNPFFMIKDGYELLLTSRNPKRVFFT